METLLEGAESSTQRRVIRDLVALSKDDRYGPGQVLPPERDLSRTLSVSRPTLRLVLKRMEQHGLVRPHGSRQRTFVGTIEASTESTATQTTPDNLLSDTVVVLARSTSAEGPRTFDSAIEAGAFRYLADQPVHVLVLDPALLVAGKERALLAQPPKAVLAKSDTMIDRVEQSLVDRLIKGGTPVVLYGQPDENPGLNVIGSDHAAGAEMLVEHLASIGRRRILPMWALSENPEKPRPWLVHRELGYRRGCERLGLETLTPIWLPLPFAEHLSPEGVFEQRVRTAAGFLYEHLRGDNPVDALMATADHPAAVLAAACRYLGVDPKRDVSIVGYDNHYDLPLTDDSMRFEQYMPAATIDKDNLVIGRALAKAALELADRPEGDDAPLIQRLIRPRLIVPGSDATESSSS
ncbi:MAG: substrate-binding domain-containing protein [Planctomycetota bacterium]